MALESSVTKAVRTREERARRPLSPPAGQTEMDRRFSNAIRANAKSAGLHYRLRAQHVPGVGVTIQTDHVGPDGEPARWTTVGVIPTGSKQAFAVRNKRAVGNVSYSNGGKPNWCRVCGAPVRGLERHAASPAHQAKVRRDVFHLIKSAWPNRSVREAFPTQLPEDATKALDARGA